MKHEARHSRALATADLHPSAGNDPHRVSRRVPDAAQSA